MCSCGNCNGVGTQANIRITFSGHLLVDSNSWFQHCFYKGRISTIRSFLHFSNDDNESSKTDGLAKIRPVIDLVKDTYISAYNSSKELCVDESMLKFKGRLFFKQYLPSKPSIKWGMKIWSLRFTNRISVAV